MELSDLIAIEEIKQLKARYLRLMDQGQWDAFAELFTADVEQSWTPAPGEGSASQRRYTDRTSSAYGWLLAHSTWTSQPRCSRSRAIFPTRTAPTVL